MLPKSGYCKERLVAIVSPVTSHAGAPLTLFEGSERTNVDAEIAQVRDRVSERLPPYMVPTVWIAVGALPKLVSGKLDRKRVQQWLTGMNEEEYQRAIPSSDQPVSEDEPANEQQRALRSIWARVLNLPEKQIGLERSFLSLGGDSISAMQVMGHCRKQGMGLAVQEILRSKSIVELAQAVKATHISSYEADEEVEKTFDLTPIQRLWYQLPNQGRGHFNQSFYLQLKQKTSPEDFRFAVEKIVSRHSMLRARFSFSEEHGWQQRVTEDVANAYRFRHRKVSTLEQISHDIADCQTCLSPEQGPLFAADLYEYRNEQRAFLVGQHLVIDLVSWRLILEELEEILSGGSLLPPAMPFQRWSQLQLEHAQTLEPSKVLPPTKIPKMDFSYWGIQHEDNTYGNAGHEAFELDTGLTSLFLNQCHTALRTEPVEVLLASLIHSWNQVFTDREAPAFYNEGHGREPWDQAIDISRTVGWFTTRKFVSLCGPGIHC